MIVEPIFLIPADAERYARLRRRMLREAPWAFAASPEDDVALDLARLTVLLEEEQNTIVAVENTALPSATSAAAKQATHGQPELIAVAGIVRMKQPKFAHRARIWGVFVDPDHRGKGLGRAVMATAIDLARSWPGVEYLDLGVSENSFEAYRLYESLGFEVWGREPAATDYEGRRYDEIHMTLKL